MKISVAILALCCNLGAFAQPYNGSYNFNVDPAAAYNKYLVRQSARTYIQVGPYKVLGTYFLFGADHPGNFYSKSETASNIRLSYNTYNQDVSFTSSSNPDKPLVKEAGTLDSFVLKADSLIATDMTFIYGAVLKTDEKSYFQRITNPSGSMVLFKRFKSTIGIPSNYIEAELREFELERNFYYYDSKKKTLTKLKTGYSWLKKEFSGVKNFDSLIDRNELEANPELALTKFISAL